KKTVDGVKARRLYARWKRPAKLDRNLVVIGAGSAGLVADYIAAAVRAKVTLVERHRMAGDCLNTACVPSKALIKSARVLSQIRKAGEFGLRNATAEVDFAGVMERVQRVIKAVEPHDSAARYTALGVECIQGEAHISSPWTVEISTASGTRTLNTRAIVIPAGARRFVPPIPGMDAIRVPPSDNVWELRELPRRRLVRGGGPVGCELAQAFGRLGGQQGAHGGNQRVAANAVSQHLCLRGRGRALPVHAHGVAPGVVRRSQCALRQLQKIPRRLLGDPVGDVHRSRSGSRGVERVRGEGTECSARGIGIRHRRARPGYRRRRGARH